MSCYIIGAGAALPERVVANTEIGALLGVSGDWIESNSGIRERRWVAPEQSTSDLAAAAVRDALSCAGVSAEDLDYLIGCTLSPDFQVPGIGPLVQRKLAGCRKIPAVDLRVGCAAILYSLQLGRGLIASGGARTVACFGAEAQSKGLDLSLRSAELSMLFGDGAGALILSGDEDPNRESQKARESGRFSLSVEDILLASDGDFAEDLIVRAPGTANGAQWISAGQLADGSHYGSMNGRNVILHAVRKLAEAAIEITERNGLGFDAIDLLIPHQANGNLLSALSRKLSIPRERIISNVERFGNTGGASAFIALWQAYREERLRPGAVVLIAAFGAGFTWGTALCRVE